MFFDEWSTFSGVFSRIQVKVYSIKSKINLQKNNFNLTKMKIRYLHLSDLHLTAIEKKSAVQTFNQDVVTRSLVKTIESSDFGIDFIIITGDIAFSGKPAEYAVGRVFCDELLQAAGLERQRLFLVPGNHDVDQDVITPRHIKSFYRFDDQDDITEILSDPDIFPIMMRKFDAFNAFAEYALGRRLFSETKYRFTETLTVKKQNEAYRINLVGLNSCLFAGYDGDDKQKLALGLVQVQEALQAVGTGDLCISFCHHPFACHHPADNVCTNKLIRKSDLILCGHLHEPSDAFIRNAAGQAVIIGAGAGFETRESANSFNITEIDMQTGAGRVRFYKYLPEHDLWKTDTDVCPHEADGHFSFTIANRRLSATTEQCETASSYSNSQPPAPKNVKLKESQAGIIDGNVSVQGRIGESFYLKRVMAQCDPLDIGAIDETSIDDEVATLRVSDVFTTLFLKDIKRWPHQTVAVVVRKMRAAPDVLKKSEDAEPVPVQAIEAAGAVNRLVILGRPGGGKSTLVNHIAGQLARRRRGDANTQKALPGLPSHQKPLPVRIIMRQFAAWLPDDRRQTSERTVWDFLKHQLKEMSCEEFFPSLKRTLDADGGVIFFDGLDEVRETDEVQKRTRLIQAIREFARPLTNCRIIITCREYAYRKTDAWRLPGSIYPTVELDLFRSEQIRAFTHTWYRKTGPRKGWRDKRCLAEAQNLWQAVTSWDHLKELGRYPLLLTLMAQVHGRDGYLPRDRTDLYERAVNLLLSHWENRIIRDIDGSRTVEPGLVMKLGVRVEVLRNALERVALAAHERQESEEQDRSQCADIAREELRQELAAGLGGSLDRAEEVITYIHHRAGLLHARDNRTFAFPHRTFQEYLTAKGITARADFDDFLCERIQRDLPWWQEVFLLAAGSFRKTPKFIYLIVDALLPADADTAKIDAATASYAQLAARAMGETEFSKHVDAEKMEKPGRLVKIHQRVQNWLLAAMQADDILSPRERCDAGTALNWVGDPRFNPQNWFLPDDGNSGFVEIPAGAFLMGSDKTRDEDAYKNEFPQHTVELSAYEIARYPVTVAQFRAFVEDSGYNAGKKWQNGPDNHPVVDVSWHDATAYCGWLTGKLNTGKIVTLPTEAQWEMAARGTDGRRYLWGDKPDANKANYNDTGIGATSPVGCFPGGENGYGLSDMGGNVWEWCRDRFGEYPSGPVTDPRGPQKGSFRVLRGGSWINLAKGCRSAIRSGNDPGKRISRYGFRLVAPPGQQ